MRSNAEPEPEIRATDQAAYLSQPQKLPRPLMLFWFTNVFLSALCAVIMRGGKRVFHWSYPYDFPFIPFYDFADFYCFQQRFHHFHQLDFFSQSASFGLRFMYPAPVAVLYEAFYRSGLHSFGVFLTVTLGLVFVLAAALFRAMVHRGVGRFTAALFLLPGFLLSYPFWFEYLLGNMEICIFLMVGFGVLAFLCGYSYTAAVLIGVAASMKIFPFVYLGLFFSRKQYKQLGASVFTAVAVNLVSLWLVCPSLPISYGGVRSGLDRFRLIYMLRYLPVETGFDHSLFGLLKRVIHNHYGNNLPSVFLSAYLLIAVLAGLTLYFVWIRRLPLLNQIVCLTIASILLPPTSHDYTLLHLYLPWGLLILYCLRTDLSINSNKSLNAAFICFGVLFSAESELIYHGSGGSGQLKAITLIVLLVIALRHRWELSFTSPTRLPAA